MAASILTIGKRPQCIGVFHHAAHPQPDVSASAPSFREQCAPEAAELAWQFPVLRKKDFGDPRLSRSSFFLLAVDSAGQLKGSIATERLTFLKKHHVIH